MSLAAELGREVASDPGGRRPWLGRASLRPGFINLRLADRALAASIDGILERPRPGAASRRPSPAPDQRRVRVGQPDRAADHRQRPRRVRRRPALPGARGRRPTRHARVLLQRLGQPGRQARGVGHRHCAAASRSPRTAITATTSPSSRPRSRSDVWAAAGDAGRRCAPRSSGRWASERVRAGIEASPRAPRRPLRRLEERGLAPRRGLGRAGDRAAAGRRPRLRAGRRDVVPLDRLRRRQGPGDPPLERRADLLRLRHRLRHREVQPRASTS